MTTENPRMGKLERAVGASVKAHGNIPDEYGAVVALASAYARNMDEAHEIDTETETKALYLGPHLLKVLTLLDLAPSAGSGSSGAATKGSPKGEFAKARATVMEMMRSAKRDGA